MANFDGSKVPYNWYLGLSSYEQSGTNLSKTYGNITYSSKSQMRSNGAMNIWGKNYKYKLTLDGYFGTSSSSVSDAKYEFERGSLTVSNISGISLDDFSKDLDSFNSIYLKHDDEIIGSSNHDRINSRTGDDFIWGNNGDDTLVGGRGDDLIVGGKGKDYLEGGEGSDTFGISKKMGKGGDNYDLIVDFEAGIDSIYIQGNNKGLWIDSYQGDAYIMKGRNDVIAFIGGAAGQLAWNDDGNFIM